MFISTLLYNGYRRSPQKCCLLKIRGGNQERRSDGNLGEDLGQRSGMEILEGWLGVVGCVGGVDVWHGVCKILGQG